MVQLTGKAETLLQHSLFAGALSKYKHKKTHFQSVWQGYHRPLSVGVENASFCAEDNGQGAVMGVVTAPEYR